jgi:signal transduction histidine kinase
MGANQYDLRDVMDDLRDVMDDLRDVMDDLRDVNSKDDLMKDDRH